MSEVIIQPDNPMSTLMLFDADKPALDRFIEYVSNTIESGMDDPLKVLAISKKMEYVTKRITERIKENAEREAEKHGSNPFKFMGTEMHLTNVYTKYDYSNCGDPQWNEASRVKEERETFLKALPSHQTIIVEGTGEVVTVKPPQKIQTTGIKTIIK